MRRDDVVPGMVAAIQTHGELLHWQRHLHVLLTYGAFTATSDFLELSELNLERLEIVWQEAVFALYLAEEKMEPEVVEKMRTWQHNGFSVDQSVLLAAGDQAGIERLAQYMIRCPFSLSRLVKISESGQVVYKAEKRAHPAFLDQHGDGMQSGLKRNYQILPSLDFLAKFIQHIPATEPHLIRYDGWYSNKSRGMRKKAGKAAGFAEEVENSYGRRGGSVVKSQPPELGDAHQAGLRGCPLVVPRMWRCDGRGGLYRTSSARRDRKVLRGHQNEADHRFSSVPVGSLWQSSAPRAPPDADGLVQELDSASSDWA